MWKRIWLFFRPRNRGGRVRSLQYRQLKQRSSTMRILIWIVRGIVILLMVWFAAKNAHVVELKGYMDASVQAPLVLILLAFFGGGLLIGLLAELMTIVRLKREIRKLNRALQQKTRDADAALPAVQVNNANG